MKDWLKYFLLSLAALVFGLLVLVGVIWLIAFHAVVGIVIMLLVLASVFATVSQLSS